MTHLPTTPHPLDSTDIVANAKTPADRKAISFVIHLAKALHSYGTPAHRLEEVITVCAHEIGIQAQAFSLPTSIFISFGPSDDQQTFCLRVEPGDVHLERLTLLDRVWNRVIAKELTPTQGIDEIETIIASPPRYNTAINLAAFTLISGTAARFFGGGWREMIVALAIGFIIGIIGELAAKRRDTRRLFDFLAGFTAAFLAVIATLIVGKLSTTTVMLGSLIILLPGLTLTVAINELATRNLMSGTARLMGALMVFAAIGFGVALGRHVGILIVPLPDAEPIPAPAWSLYITLIIATLCLGILFRARTQDLWLVMTSGFVAFFGARLGTQALGPELGVLIGAMLVGIGSNLYARIADRPAAVPLLPGILLLVPGGIGFMSVNSLLSHNVLSGIETAFSMFLIAAGLVAGLLLANVAVPSHKAL